MQSNRALLVQLKANESCKDSFIISVIHRVDKKSAILSVLDQNESNFYAMLTKLSIVTPESLEINN